MTKDTIMLNIETYNEALTDELMDLLLTADPSKESIESYFNTSTILTCRDADRQKIIAVAVLSGSKDWFELRNLAVLDKYQKQGVAKRLIGAAKSIAAEMGAISLEVGTGNSSLSQLALYQKCGFRIHSIVADYFESYPEPIIENGILCLDLLRLRADLVSK